MRIKFPTYETLVRVLFVVSVLVIVVASVFVIGFGYGFISHKDRGYPPRLLHEAILAASALFSSQTERRNPAYPGGFKSYENSVTSGPKFYALNSEPSAEAEYWVLVVGGPYQYLEKCPNFGCMAWVIDRSGAVIHTWEVDLDALWADADHVAGHTRPHNFKPTHVRLLPDGSIIVVFWNNFSFPQGAGLAKFDIDGKLIWTRRDNSHHWFTTDSAGNIYTPAHFARKTPFPLGTTAVDLKCNQIEATIDFIQVTDAAGRKIEEIPLFDILIQNGYAGLIATSESTCDPLHLNFVQYVDAATASRTEGLEAGDLLVSMRSINTVALLDPKRRKIKWLIGGLSLKQHSPRFLPDGSLVIFDNYGGDRSFGGSRIARHRIFEYSAETLFPAKPLPGDRRFFTKYAGYIAVHPDGDQLLVSLTEVGGIWEISLKSGDVNWIYEKVFPTVNYPNADTERNKFVRVEAHGASYVDRRVFAAVLAARSKE